VTIWNSDIANAQQTRLGFVAAHFWRESDRDQLYEWGGKPSPSMNKQAGSRAALRPTACPLLALRMPVIECG
jgi:hypothetical protein